MLILGHGLTICLSVSLTGCLASQEQGLSLAHSFRRSFPGTCSMLSAGQGSKNTKQTRSLDSHSSQHKMRTIIQHSALSGGPLVSVE